VNLLSLLNQVRKLAKVVPPSAIAELIGALQSDNKADALSRIKDVTRIALARKAFVEALRRAQG
jgi:hypothetical protein